MLLEVWCAKIDPTLKKIQKTFKKQAFLMSFFQFSWLFLKVALFQKVQDNFFIAQIAKIIIPFYYPKLLHPVHGIEKSIIYFDTFFV